MRKILVVDDDPAIMRLLSAVLRYEAMQVVQAHRGDEALEVVAREEPDLVLMDFAMPGMDGLEVCRQIKENSRTAATPVIIMTGVLARADRKHILAQGADGFIQKPFSVTQLLEVINAVAAPRSHVGDGACA